MPATSGSPTQIATSQPTKVALSNTPSDQFQGGDLAYVQEEFVAGRCALYALVPTSGPAVNGVTVLAVYQNANARWVALSLVAPSGTLVVPNIAALQALDSAGYPSGQLVNVQTLRSAGYFVLDKDSTATPDNITVVDALNATGNWLRQENEALSWTYQTTWYVDPAAGNDEGTGATPATALKTVAELARRLTCVFQGALYTVNLLGNIPVTDSFVDKRRIVTGAATKTANGSSIMFVGVRTVTGTYTSAAGTKNTDPNTAAASAQAEVVRAAGSWTSADVGKLLVDSGGNTAWVLTEKDAAATARVTDWLTSAGFWQATPVVGDTSSICTVTTWRAPIITGASIGPQSAFGVGLYFQNIEFDDYNGSQDVGGVFNGGAFISLWVCKISDSGGLGTAPAFFAGGSYGLALLQGVLVQHKDAANSYAFFDSGAKLSPGLMVQWLWGNGGRRIKLVLTMSPTQILGFCVQAGWVECGSVKADPVAASHNIGAAQSGSWLGVYQDFGSLNVATLAAIQVNNAGRLRIDGSVYGTAAGAASAGNISGLSSTNGGTMWLAKNMIKYLDVGATSTLCFNLVPKGPDEFSLDALANTVGSITAANGGAVLPISIVCTSWAQYIGAVPNGWARNMRNPSNNGGFYQGI